MFLLENADLLEYHKGQIFLDRDPKLFSYVIEALRAGTLLEDRDLSEQARFEIAYWLDNGDTRKDQIL